MKDLFRGGLLLKYFIGFKLEARFTFLKALEVSGNRLVPENFTQWAIYFLIINVPKSSRRKGKVYPM